MNQDERELPTPRLEGPPPIRAYVAEYQRRRRAEQAAMHDRFAERFGRVASHIPTGEGQELKAALENLREHGRTDEAVVRRINEGYAQTVAHAFAAAGINPTEIAHEIRSLAGGSGTFAGAILALILGFDSTREESAQSGGANA